MGSDVSDATFSLEDNPPLVQIVSPVDGSLWVSPAMVRGYALDPEDGDAVGRLAGMVIECGWGVGQRFAAPGKPDGRPAHPDPHRQRLQRAYHQRIDHYRGGALAERLPADNEPVKGQARKR